MLPIWKDISVSKKLYVLIGTMAILITLELVTLSFAMSTLSSVRGFVHGEGLWSKAQKDSIHSLYEYAITKDAKHYNDFYKYMEIPLGDRRARMELERANPNLENVRQGFIDGGIHPKDIDGRVNLLQRFGHISYLKKAVALWTEGDSLIDELIGRAEILHQQLGNGGTINTPDIRLSLEKIRLLNDQMTKVENAFSDVMGAGSRWLENILMVALLCLVLTIVGMGLLLTISFGRGLNRNLKELIEGANKIGQGNFDVTVPIRSKDELGQLSVALNKMIADLKRNIGDRQVAESANQVKTFFLANMSHEIRTPLGVILGLAEILRDPQTSEGEK